MVTIREARPADVPFLSWIVLAAGRSQMETSFWDLFLDHPGDAAVERYLERLLRAPFRSWWHHAHFLIAEEEGVPLAALSGFAPGDPAVRSPESALVQTIREHGWDEGAVQQGLVRAAPFFTCTLSPEEGTWLVENVATRPEARRRGLVARLLPPILEQGHRRGFTRAQLTCFLGNDGAQLAYERAGFRVVSERRHPDFEAAIGCPGLARMECPL